MNADIKNKIEFLAKQKAYSDKEDFNAADVSGGNFDDAFSMGIEDGEVLLARTSLAMFGDSNTREV